jgi:uncharacterized membrane protein
MIEREYAYARGLLATLTVGVLLLAANHYDMLLWLILMETMMVALIALYVDMAWLYSTG